MITKIVPIRALKDNYIWLLHYENDKVIIVDPGEAAPVLRYLKQENVIPRAILITHHHHDHLDGVAEIVLHYPQIIVFGPEEVQRALSTLPVIQTSNSITIDELTFEIIETPGHTLQHVVYYHAPYLFTGDTLFSAGCGRLFEGTAKNMYFSLKKLTHLPDDTLMYCAHEYTLKNLQFAHSVASDNVAIDDYLTKLTKNASNTICTLPSTLGIEKKINLFFMAVNETSISDENPCWLKFAKLRKLRDNC